MSHLSPLHARAFAEAAPGVQRPRIDATVTDLLSPSEAREGHQEKLERLYVEEIGDARIKVGGQIYVYEHARHDMESALAAAREEITQLKQGVDVAVELRRIFEPPHSSRVPSLQEVIEKVRALQQEKETLRKFARHPKDCKQWRCKTCGYADCFGVHYNKTHPDLHKFVEDCTCGLAALLDPVEGT